MKPITLNLQIVVNIGNYESLRLGAEWTPESDNTTAEMIAADKQLRETACAIIDARKTPAVVINANDRKDANGNQIERPQGENKTQVAQQHVESAKVTQMREKAARKPLTLESKELQPIIKRIESGVKLEKVLEYYEPDEQALNALKIAAKLN